MKKRLDQQLVDLGLAPSKTKAQEMIELGQVWLTCIKTKKKTCALKPAQKISTGELDISVSSKNLLQYVSRAGFKLKSALEHLNLDVKNKFVLDVGQSTGGFTDCLLQEGAKHVTGIDVAENELSQKLALDPRVTAHTKLNVKEINTHPDLKNKQFDLAVVDVSFISLDKVLPHVWRRLKSGGHLLALVKPQFEVGRVNMNKSGMVKNTEALAALKQQILHLVQKMGVIETQYFESQIKGRDGNQEYFLYGKKA